MDLREQIAQIAKRYQTAGHAIQTEEATKTSLVVPLIAALGYDIYNPFEVIPEFCAELPGTKKGDKVDYVIQKEGAPIILIECKHHAQSLSLLQESQLMRYFHALTTSKIAILTNGIKYLFYTDLDDKNKMDTRPFMDIDITAVTDAGIKELSKYSKASFDLETIIPAAEEMKYTGAIKKYLHECLVNPDESFVRVLAEQVYDGRLTERMREKFKEIVKKALAQFISERISDRLATALSEEKKASAAEDDKDADPKAADAKGGGAHIETTREEIEAHAIIKAVLRKTVDARRVAMRDAVSYCAILLDDNNRRPICRLYLNNPKNMQIGLIAADKSEQKHPIDGLDAIYNFSDQLVENVASLCAAIESRKASTGNEEAS